MSDIPIHLRLSLLTKLELEPTGGGLSIEIPKRGSIEQSHWLQSILLRSAWLDLLLFTCRTPQFAIHSGWNSGLSAPCCHSDWMLEASVIDYRMAAKTVQRPNSQSSLADFSEQGHAQDIENRFLHSFRNWSISLSHTYHGNTRCFTTDCVWPEKCREETWGKYGVCLNLQAHLQVEW